VPVQAPIAKVAAAWRIGIHRAPSTSPWSQVFIAQATNTTPGAQNSCKCDELGFGLGSAQQAKGPAAEVLVVCATSRQATGGAQDRRCNRDNNILGPRTREAIACNGKMPPTDDQIVKTMQLARISTDSELA